MRVPSTSVCFRFSLVCLFLAAGAWLLPAQQGSQETAVFRPLTDQPGLPRVLLIGDSISIGYTLPVRKLLAGKANVHRVLENGGPTTNGVAKIDSWIGNGHWDVIHFNFGLHDLKLMGDGLDQVPVEQYEENLSRLVMRLKQTGARLIWATTTPVPEGRMGVPRRSADVPVYNAAAERVMMQQGVEINDMYSFALPLVVEIQRPVNVHFTDPGYERLAERVAASIQRALERRSQDPAAKSMLPEHHFFRTSDGIRLHYVDSGQGPAIIFVPGSSMPAEIWQPQIEHFGDRYRIVAVDPRSQGHSSQSAEGNYPERRARDIRELIEQLKLGPVLLVAWSMSVRDTLAYVSQFGTSDLRGIVLVDGAILPPNAQQRTSILTELKTLQAERPAFTRSFVRSMFRKPQPEAYLEKITALSLRTPTNTVLALSTNAFITDWTPALARFDKPVLYIYSSPTRSADAELLKNKVPAAKIEMMAGTGHALFVDEAARFNSLLETFVRNLP